MSTPKKATNGKKYMTCDKIAQIDELNGLKLPTKKIADYLDLSQSTVQRYILAIKAIYSGTDYYSSNPLNDKAIRSYCEMLGIERVPVNTYFNEKQEEQTQGAGVQQGDPPASDVITLLQEAVRLLHEINELLK